MSLNLNSFKKKQIYIFNIHLKCLFFLGFIEHFYAKIFLYISFIQTQANKKILKSKSR